MYQDFLTLEWDKGKESYGFPAIGVQASCDFGVEARQRTRFTHNRPSTYFYCIRGLIHIIRPYRNLFRKLE